MKKLLLTPFSLGLLLAGCSHTDSPSLSASASADANNKPASYDSTASMPSANGGTTSAIAPVVVSAPAPAAAEPAISDATVAADRAAAEKARSAQADADRVAADKAATDKAAADQAAAGALAADTKAGADVRIAADVDAVTANAATTADNSNAISATISPTTTAALDSLSTHITEWNLSSDAIKDEVQSGRVERSKAHGAGEPTGPMDDVIVKSIDGKLKQDADTMDLSLNISANHGEVTLNGSAKSLEQISKAIALSLDTAGVNKATSLIKLDTTP